MTNEELARLEEFLKHGTPLGMVKQVRDAAPALLAAARENARLRAVVEAAKAMQTALEPVADDGKRKTFMLANLVAAREKLDAALSALDAKGGG